MGLLDEATVVRGDGPWSNGYDLEESGCGIAVRVAEVCAPTFTTVIGNPAGVPNVLKIEAFGIDAVLARDVRCALDQDLRRVDMALEAGQERAIGYVFERGPVASWESPHLKHADVQVLAATGTTVLQKIGEALAAWYGKAVGDPLVHLGLAAMLDLIDSTSSPDMLESIGATPVFSPGYSTGLIAVTGPVTVKIGTSQTVQAYGVTNNRTEIQATEVAAIEFDVCHAVRVGP
jgi:hypothetical protein